MLSSAVHRLEFWGTRVDPEGLVEDEGEGAPLPPEEGPGEGPHKKNLLLFCLKWRREF